MSAILVCGVILFVILILLIFSRFYLAVILEHDVITGPQVGAEIRDGDVVEIYKEENDGSRSVT